MARSLGEPKQTAIIPRFRILDRVKASFDQAKSSEPFLTKRPVMQTSVAEQPISVLIFTTPQPTPLWTLEPRALIPT